MLLCIPEQVLLLKQKYPTIVFYAHLLTLTNMDGECTYVMRDLQRLTGISLSIQAKCFETLRKEGLICIETIRRKGKMSRNIFIPPSLLCEKTVCFPSAILHDPLLTSQPSGRKEPYYLAISLYIVLHTLSELALLTYTLGDYHRITGASKTSITHALVALEKAGYILLHRDPMGKRHVILLSRRETRETQDRLLPMAMTASHATV